MKAKRPAAATRQIRLSSDCSRFIELCSALAMAGTVSILGSCVFYPRYREWFEFLRVLRVSVLKLLRKRSTTEARRARRSTKTGFSRQTPLESGLNNQFCSDRLQRFDPRATTGCSNNLSVSYLPASRPFATTPRNRNARIPTLEILRSDRRCSDKQRGAME